MRIVPVLETALVWLAVCATKMDRVVTQRQYGKDAMVKDFEVAIREMCQPSVSSSSSCVKSQIADAEAILVQAAASRTDSSETVQQACRAMNRCPREHESL